MLFHDAVKFTTSDGGDYELLHCTALDCKLSYCLRSVHSVINLYSRAVLDS